MRCAFGTARFYSLGLVSGGLRKQAASPFLDPKEWPCPGLWPASSAPWLRQRVWPGRPRSFSSSACVRPWLRRRVLLPWPTWPWLRREFWRSLPG